jgi:hypothetical protein
VFTNLVVSGESFVNLKGSLPFTIERVEIGHLELVLPIFNLLEARCEIKVNNVLFYVKSGTYKRLPDAIDAVLLQCHQDIEKSYQLQADGSSKKGQWTHDSVILKNLEQDILNTTREFATAAGLAAALKCERPPVSATETTIPLAETPVASVASAAGPPAVESAFCAGDVDASDRSPPIRTLPSLPQQSPLQPSPQTLPQQPPVTPAPIWARIWKIAAANAAINLNDVEFRFHDLVTCPDHPYGLVRAMFRNIDIFSVVCKI